MTSALKTVIESLEATPIVPNAPQTTAMNSAQTRISDTISGNNAVGEKLTQAFQTVAKGVDTLVNSPLPGIAPAPAPTASNTSTPTLGR